MTPTPFSPLFNPMPSERNQLHRELRLAERDLKGIQAVVLVLLSILVSYAEWLVYIRDGQALIGLLPSTTAACAALLVAKTATRLLTYNMLVRADDRAHEIVRVTHHSMAVINDLRGRVRYMKIALSEGNRPLVALTQNAEAIQKRYEVLYDRELYRYLPGTVIDGIVALSGAVFGLSALVAGVASALDGKEHAVTPAGNSTDRSVLVQAISELESELDALFSQVENLRATVE
jgi:hypothetical protein